jgi:C-terminal processing protease CtpA/Prc
MTPEKLDAAVAPYISYENDVWLHQQSPSFMTIVELLRHLGIASDDGSVEFTMAKPGDKPFTMKISPANPGVRVPLVNVTDAFHIPTPLFRKQPQSYYWYEYLAEQRTLYIQYNRCQDDPQLSFAEFTKKVLDFADAHPVERVIVDLRFNSGGNSNVIKPLENGLKARPALSKYGHLYALMGRATFSSGLLAAVDFRDDLHAILIGEPSGEKPNSYGEIKYLTLPNSKVEVQYSTKFFTIIKNGDPTTFDPDVSVPHSLADALAGRDPALEAALHHPLQ